MAAAEPRGAGAAPPGYAGEGPGGGGRGLKAPLCERRVTAVSPAALAVKFGERQRSPHCLLVKEHRVREGPGDAHPPARTLFVLNVPPYCGPVSARGDGDGLPAGPGRSSPALTLGSRCRRQGGSVQVVRRLRAGAERGRQGQAGAGGEDGEAEVQVLRPQDRDGNARGEATAASAVTRGRSVNSSAVLFSMSYRKNTRGDLAT